MAGDFDLRMGMPFFKNPIEYKNRGVCVDAVVIDGANRTVLLIERGVEPHAGRLALPGGHVNFDETVEQACGRELFEETGLSAVTMKLVGVYSHPMRDPAQNISIAYLVWAGGKLKAGDDAAHAAFMPLFGEYSLAFDHNRIVEDAWHLFNQVPFDLDRKMDVGRGFFN